MSKISANRLARSLMEIHIQTELKQSDIKVLYVERSENYINYIRFLYKPLNTIMLACRGIGTRWDITPVPNEEA